MLDLETAKAIADAALEYGRKNALNPLTTVVMDERGSVKTVQSQDGSSLLRFKIAHGKANGAIGLGMGSRSIFKRAQKQPFFIVSINGAADGDLVPVPGGVLVRDKQGRLLGAVGITGDTSDNDEAAAVYAIERIGLVADTG
jgi:uncharacterized protein GlcG (DUF336 family)